MEAKTKEKRGINVRSRVKTGQW